MYNVWSSGAHHAPHAMFTKLSMQIHGRKIGLLRGAGTRMASFLYAMVRALRLKSCLEATVESPAHIQLDKTRRMINACIDVKNHKVWNAFYVLCGVSHGPMLTLRYSDAGEAAMDKVYYWSCKTCNYIKENEDEINAVELFSGEGAIEEDGGFNEELNMFFSDRGQR